MLIVFILISAFCGLMMLFAVTYWQKKEIPRAVAYATGAFLMMSITITNGTIKGVETLLIMQMEQQKNQPYENQQSKIPPYSGNRL